MNSFKVFYVLLSIITLAIYVWAYRKSRRFGWLLMALSGLIGLSSLAVLPMIRASKQRAWFTQQHQLSPEAEKSFMEESLALTKKYYPAVSPQPVLPPRFELVISLIGAILWTGGLWLIAQQEPRKDKAESVAGGNAR